MREIFARMFFTLSPSMNRCGWNAVQNFASPESKFCYLITGKELVETHFSLQQKQSLKLVHATMRSQFWNWRLSSSDLFSCRHAAPT
jgi:hypothetical protein